MPELSTFSVSETVTLTFESIDEARQLLGRGHELVRLLEAGGDVEVVARGEELRLTGPAEKVAALAAVLKSLQAVLRRGGHLGPDEMRYAIEGARRGDVPSPSALLFEDIAVGPTMAPVQIKTAGQQRYARSIREHDITFAVGPAGTGKTYVAVAMAVNAFVNHRVDRLVFCRPAVEAGEALGFLPGDMREKVDPYLRPLYDALYDMFPIETASRLQADGKIEVVPLAYMRGRTLNKCFVILDEAQNTTSGQMRMFLTRLGRHSQAVITGDVTQIDLADRNRSGLVEATALLADIAGIAFVNFDKRDVVRHRLVQDIIHAYEQRDEAAAPDTDARRSDA